MVAQPIQHRRATLYGAGGLETPGAVGQRPYNLPPALSASQGCGTGSCAVEVADPPAGSPQPDARQEPSNRIRAAGTAGPGRQFKPLAIRTDATSFNGRTGNAFGSGCDCAAGPGTVGNRAKSNTVSDSSSLRFACRHAPVRIRSICDAQPGQVAWLASAVGTTSPDNDNALSRACILPI